MPTHTAAHGSVEDWFKAFYAVSDDGTAHDDYVTFYAPDAKLIMGDKTANGHDEIIATRTAMWEKISSRRHTYELFQNQAAPNTYLIQGTVVYGFKAGGEDTMDWVAKAVFTGEGKERRLDFYQVFLNAGRK